MWELDHKEGWVPKNWCFQILVLEKTLESPLDSKEIKPVHPKGNQPWILIRSTDAEAKSPILWPPDAKNQLKGKDPDSGKGWGQEEKGMTEDEMVGWHHRLNGLEFEQAPENSEGRGGLACCSSRDCKAWDTTEQLALSLFIVRYAGKNSLIFYTVENFLKFYVYLWKKISADIEFQVDRFLVLYDFPLSSLTICSIIFWLPLFLLICQNCSFDGNVPPPSTPDAFTIFSLWSKELMGRIQSNHRRQRVVREFLKQIARERESYIPFT